MNLEDALINTNQNKSQQTTQTANIAASSSEEFRPVDISIAGVPHRVICPVSEIKNLENGAEYINQKIRTLRQEIKNKHPSNEELLILICLDLFDQVNKLQAEISNHTQNQKQAQILIDKISKAASSLL